MSIEAIIQFAIDNGALDDPSLRQAIEQAEQKVTSLQCAHCQVTIDTLNDKVMYLMGQAQKQEPVAHRDGFWCADLTCKKCYSADFRFKHKNSVVNESLTTPPQRQPLTDEQIDKICGDVGYGYIDVARAIEAAHGITGELK